MSYFTDRLKEADECEEQARLLIEKAGIIRNEVRANCPHEYAGLEFNYGIGTSYLSDRIVHTMRIHCKVCNTYLDNRLVEYKD